MKEPQIGWWEDRPWAIAILLGVVAIAAGVVGFEIAQHEPPMIINVEVPHGIVVTIQPARTMGGFR